MAGKSLSRILEVMRAARDRGPVIGSKSPFQVLIATVLSQRTRDENTALASKSLFEKYPDAKTLSKARLSSVEKLIKQAGFYRVKAVRVKEIAALVAKKHGGVVPSDLNSLVALPGVGRKTANCVLVYGFGIPALPVDTHVHRISNRLGLVKTKTPEQTEGALAKAVSKKHWIEINHLMVRYGQTVCLPRNPKCQKCRLKQDCDYFSSISSEKQV